MMKTGKSFAFDYDTQRVGHSEIVHADCLEWLSRVPENSFHAIVTDPPYGVKEYDFEQLKKMTEGRGGVWRIPPSFDGHTRAPLPRFTALDASERRQMRAFFVEWSRLIEKAIRPGGHVLIATNAFIAELLYESLVEGGLEFRGQIIRLVRTLRGGDRPKNAEAEFSGVSSMPKNCQSDFSSFAPTTFVNRNGLGSIPNPTSRDVFESKQKTISQTSSGLCPCHPLICLLPFISMPSAPCNIESPGIKPLGSMSGCPLWYLFRTIVLQCLGMADAMN